MRWEDAVWKKAVDACRADDVPIDDDRAVDDHVKDGFRFERLTEDVILSGVRRLQRRRLDVSRVILAASLDPWDVFRKDDVDRPARIKLTGNRRGDGVFAYLRSWPTVNPGHGVVKIASEFLRSEETWALDDGDIYFVAFPEFHGTYDHNSFIYHHRDNEGDHVILDRRMCIDVNPKSVVRYRICPSSA